MDLDKDLYDEMSGAVDDLKKITDPDSAAKDVAKDAHKDNDPAEGEAQKTSRKASG